MLPRLMWAKACLIRQEREVRSEAVDLETGYGTLTMPEKQPQSEFSSSPRPRTTHALGLDWMAHLDDDTPVSMLTIPGTHDSAAYTYPWPFVATQTMSIGEQLEAGVRYFDFRCGVRDDVVEMVHGPTYLGIKLHQVLDTIYTWLASHPSEALIVQIKKDKDEQRSTMRFAQAIFSVLAQKSECWRTANTIPTLGQLRGRIQLFRRFWSKDLHAYGMDLTGWEDNPSEPFTLYTRHGVQVTIQDHYSFPDAEPLPSLIRKKGGDVSQLLDRAAKDMGERHWYINFTSAYEFNLYYQLTPREVAVGAWWGFSWEDGMNVRLRAYMAEHEGQRRRLGIVAMDFPDLGAEDLIDALIQSNFEQKPEIAWGRLWMSWVFLLAMFALSAIFMLLYGSAGHAASTKEPTRTWLPQTLIWLDSS